MLRTSNALESTTSTPLFKATTLRTKTAHEFIKGYIPQRKEYIELLAANAPGSASDFKMFLKHLEIIGMYQDPLEYVKHETYAKALRFFQKGVTKHLVALPLVQATLLNRLAEATDDIFLKLAYAVQAFSPSERRNWPREKIITIRDV